MRTDIGILLAGVRSAARLPLRLVAMAAVLLTMVLYAAMTTVIGGPDLRACISATFLLWFLWSVTGGVILRGSHLSFAGRPVRGCIAHGTKRFVSHFGAPLLLALIVAGLLALAWCLLQVVRIPFVGWPLIIVLSPVLLLISFTAVRLLLGWLFAGFLVGPSIAEGTADAYRGLFRAQAYWKAGPCRVVGVRLLALGTWVCVTACHLVLYALALGGLWLVLGQVPGDHDSGLACALRDGLACAGGLSATASVVAAGLLAAFILSRPAAGFFGARAAAYLVLRRDLDDVPVDAPIREADPEKSLEDLGIELVRRLRDEPEEDR